MNREDREIKIIEKDFSYQQRYLKSGYSCRHHQCHFLDWNCGSLYNGQSRTGDPSSHSCRTQGGVVKVTANWVPRAYPEVALRVQVLWTYRGKGMRLEEDSIHRSDARGGVVKLLPWQHWQLRRLGVIWTQLIESHPDCEV